MSPGLSSEEIENTYRICNSAGEQVYYAQEGKQGHNVRWNFLFL